MKPLDYKDLSPEEKSPLLDAPAIVSVLSAISNDGIIDANEKADAIKLAHLRTFTAADILKEFYTEVDKNFESSLNRIIDNLPADEQKREKHLSSQLSKCTPVLSKLDREFSLTYIDSLKSFAKHVFHSNAHFLEYFILPVFMNEIEKEVFKDVK